MVNELAAQMPAKAMFLVTEKHRYKGLYGGRGSAKSWSMARALVLAAATAQERILCVRETMKSIADSVHQLIADQIKALNLGAFFTVEKARIKGPNGSFFTFGGLRNDPDAIKSMEGATKVWAEEAAAISRRSWDILIPTIRQPNSEIWLSWNPELVTDDTHQRFLVNPPPNAKIVKMNFSDNPWFPEVLRAEMEYCKRTDPRKYEHIWLGAPISEVEGAIYAAQIAQAEVEGRITRVPVDPSKPVHTFWDLGWSDHVAIWFGQACGLEYRIVDYVEANKTQLSEFIRILGSKGYSYGTDYLPHDAVAGQFSAGGRSIQQQMLEYGRKVQIVPRTNKLTAIEASRALFPLCYFDAQKCADGLQRLRHYRWDAKDNGRLSREPLHDVNSNGADAFQQLALSIKPNSIKPAPKRQIITGVYS